MVIRNTVLAGSAPIPAAHAFGPNSRVFPTQSFVCGRGCVGARRCTWHVRALAPGSTPISAAVSGVPPSLNSSDGRLTSLNRSGESEVLSRPPKTELHPVELINVFGYQRDIDSKYALGDWLGAGAFGVVRVGTELGTERRWAVKTISKTPKSGRATPRYLKKLQTEVDAMRQLGASLDACHLKDVFEDEVAVHLVMELCEGGSVLDGLRQGEYCEKQVQHIMRSVMRFLAQAHSKGIIYRDVKPDNFLAKHRDWTRHMRDMAGGGVPAAAAAQHLDSPIKATDFGLAIWHRLGDPPLKSRSGTPAYMAPEVVQQCYATPADVWSAGTMMYQLLTGKFPFWDTVKDCTLQDVWRAILTDKVNFQRPELQQVSTTARSLLVAMLERNPQHRITAAQALHHPWLKEELPQNLPPIRAQVVQRLQRFATHGQLRQMVLRAIAGTVGPEHVGEMHPEAREWLQSARALFQEFDVDASGSVSAEELTDGLARLGFQLSQGELDTLMSRLYASPEGALQMNEFLACLVDWGILQRSSHWRTWVRAVFDRFDKDGNGYIDLQELAMELGGSGTPTPNDEDPLITAQRMLREADVNGDGQVSWPEFLELVDVGEDALEQYDSRLARPCMAGMDEDLSGSSADQSLDSQDGA